MKLDSSWLGAWRPGARRLRKLASVLVVLVAAQSVVADAVADGGRPVLLGDGVVSLEAEGVEGSFAFRRGSRATKLESLPEGWVAGGMRETPNGVDLFLVERRGDEVRELEVPVGEGARWRSWATPLVDGGEFAGLLWLEGDRHDRLAVRASARTSRGWEEVETVSSPGAGSQVAISGAILNDGSWLAVWTQVDKEGDAETVWSLRRGGGWSPPARIHENNAVHDVQPILTRVDGGALVVWSAFDGNDYRLRRARFDGRNWTTSGFFGERGVADMRFESLPLGIGAPASATRLLFSTVVPSTWSVLDFDARGELVAAGAVNRDPHDSGPVLLSRGTDGGALLVWPSFDKELVERETSVDMTPVASVDD